MAEDAHLETFERAAKLDEGVWRWRTGACRVCAVWPCKRIQQQRTIARGPGQWAAMVKREGIGDDTGAANQTIGRL